MSQGDAYFYNKTINIYIKSILGILFLILPLHAHCASEKLGQLSFESIDFSEHIPQEITTKIFQDTKGFIWIGTKNGLLRFDGLQFKLFKHQQNNVHSLSGNYITAILESPDGELWIGTKNHGISVYSQTKAHFKSIKYTRESNSISSNNINTLFLNTDKGIWVGTAKGLDYIDFKMIKTKNIIGSNSSFKNKNITSLLLDSTNILWAGTDSGLYKQDSTNGNFKPFKPFNSEVTPFLGEYITRLYQDNKDIIWVGTKTRGYAWFDKATQDFKRSEQLVSINNALSKIWIKDILQINNNEIWIATFGMGVIIVDAINGEVIEHIKHNIINQHSINSDFVSTIYKDASELIWLGTWGAGINKLNYFNSAFRTLRYNPSSTKSLTHSNVGAITEIENGQLLIGTSGNGIDILDLHNSQIEGFKTNVIGIDHLTQGSISAIVRAANDTLWVGTQNSGLYKSNINNKFELIDINNGLLNNAVTALLSDGHEVWIGTQAGLSLFDQNNNQMTYFKDPNSRIFKASVTAITLGENKNLWVGTHNGLYLLNRSSGQLKRFIHDVTNKKSLLGNTINDVFFDSKRQLWIDTNKGLNKLVNDNNVMSFESINVKLNIPDFKFDGKMLEDDFGRLVSAKYVLDPKTWRVWQLSKADGIDIGVSLNGAHFKTESGLLFYGGTKGVLIIYPSRFMPLNTNPNVQITNAKIDSENVIISNKLTIPANHKGFSVAFASLDFSEPKSIKYRYKLENYNDNWIGTNSNNRTISYHNLKPGNYLLKIQGSDRYGKWSTNEISLPITINAAWYQSILFKLLLLFLTIFLLFFLYKLRLSSLKVKQRLLQSAVDEQTKDLLLLDDIGKELTQTLDFNLVLIKIYQQFDNIFKPDSFLIGIYDKPSSIIKFPIAVEDNHKINLEDMKVEDKFRPAVWCIDNNKEIIIQTEQEWFDYFEQKNNPIFGQEVQTIIYQPLCVGNIIIGCLSLQSSTENAFNKKQLDMIRTITSYAAIAVANSLGYCELQKQKLATISALNKVSALLNSTNEGFLTFNSDLNIESQLSTACYKLLNDDHLVGRHISDVLFIDQELDKKTFNKGVKLLFETIDELKQEFLLDLLPKQVEVFGKTLKLDFKLESAKVILRFIDISLKLNLTNALLIEQKTNKKLIYAVKHHADLISIIKDFKKLQLPHYFTRNEYNLEQVESLFRKVHTFKGLFLQLYFEELAQSLHDIESYLRSHLNKFSYSNKETLINLMNVEDINLILKKETDIILNTLGVHFLDDIYTVNIHTDELNFIADLINQNTNLPNFDKASKILENKKKKNIRLWLKKHADYCMHQAVSLGKCLNKIEVMGDEVLLSEEKYNQFMQSLLHVFRNAVTHGIETLEERECLGKETSGNISVCVIDHNDNFTIEIEDDGKGIDTDAIKHRYVTNSDADKSLNKENILNRIFDMGASSKPNVSIDSGRGVGLTEVKHQIKKLNGKIIVKSIKNEGTSFSFNIPKL